MEKAAAIVSGSSPESCAVDCTMGGGFSQIPLRVGKAPLHRSPAVLLPCRVCGGVWEPLHQSAALSCLISSGAPASDRSHTLRTILLQFIEIYVQ